MCSMKFYHILTKKTTRERETLEFIFKLENVIFLRMMGFTPLYNSKTHSETPPGAYCYGTCRDTYHVHFSDAKHWIQN